MTLLVGCGPMRVWQGWSPDHSRQVVLVESGGEQYLQHAGADGVRYGAIAIETIRFGRNGRRLAYAALREDRWLVSIDGVESDRYRGIGEVVVGGPTDQVAFAAQREDGWHVVRGSREGEPWQALGRGTLGIGADGRLSFVGFRSERAYVVIEGASHGPYRAVVDLARAPRSGRIAFLVLQDGGCSAVVERDGGGVDTWSDRVRHDRCGELTFGGDGASLAYVGDSRGCSELVIDGAARSGCGVRHGSVRSSPEGRRFAYVREDGDEVCVVVDDSVSCGWEDAEPPVFGMEGERWGAVVRRGGRAHVVIDGRRRASHSWAADLQLSGLGPHHAYVARTADGSMVIHDGRAWEYSVVVEGTLALSDDGRHWACLTGDVETEELFVTVDGRPGARFEFAEIARLVAQYPAARDREDLLRQWVKAELTRLTRGAGRRSSSGPS